MIDILLNDILKIEDNKEKKVKIKFNLFNGREDPLELYKENPEAINTDWFLAHNERRYFHKGDIAVCFLKISQDIWLLTTIKEITKEIENGKIGYEAIVIDAYKKYFGRLLIKFHNKSRSVGRKFSTIKEELKVYQILTDQFADDDFPGYENVRLTYQQLQRIIERKLPGWVAALQNQKAVYVLTDTKTGKLYVGSATAKNGMLFERWATYVKNGHGNNDQLKKLVDELGLNYIKDNFQYSIIENYNARMDDSYILKRESWWKQTLLSRKFGYNSN